MDDFRVVSLELLPPPPPPLVADESDMPEGEWAPNPGDVERARAPAASPSATAADAAAATATSSDSLPRPTVGADAVVDAVACDAGAGVTAGTGEEPL